MCIRDSFCSPFTKKGMPTGKFALSELFQNTGTKSPNWYFTCILLIGCATGLTYFANYVTIQKAIASSGASTTNTISRLGSFIVALLVSVFWQEHLTALNVIGILLACTAIFLYQSGDVQMSKILPVLFIICLLYTSPSPRD